MPMITTLYIIRHGETEWNRKGLLQGQLASPLTREGIEKAESMRPEISRIDPHVVYSSDQERAMRTAGILTAGLDLEINEHCGLREMNFGVFQGLSWDYIENEMKDIYDIYREDNPDYVIPEGESHRQFHDRVVGALNEITSRHEGQRILIVSHGGAINKMLGYAEGLAPSANRFFHTRNLTLNILEFDNGRYSLKTETELLEFAAIR